MKKLSMIPVIAVGACAACCALPWLPTLLAGLLASSMGTFLIGWRSGAVLGLALLFGVLIWMRIGRRHNKSGAVPPCGCAPDPATTSRACC